MDFYLSDNYDDSITYFDKAIDIEPTYAIAWEKKGRSLEILKKYEDSIAAYNKAIELDPPNAADSWSYIGMIYFEQEKYDESVRAFKMALELNPNDYYNLMFMASGLEELQKYEEAIAAREKAITLPTDSLDYLKIARDYEILREYQKAIDTYKRALIIDPRDAEIWGYIGKNYEQLGEYQKAIETFDECQSKGLQDCSYYCVPSIQETQNYKKSNDKSTFNSLQSSQDEISTNNPNQIEVQQSTNLDSAVCDCSGDNYNCDDFPLSNSVTDQQCYEYCKSKGMGDIHELDRNNDGDTCEVGW